MFIQKNFTLKTIMNFAGFHLIWLIAWAVLVTLLHEFTHTEWLHIPWLPLSIIATAVAFYIGFKNNSAYDRLWEARKIWGAIVNSSRMWGSNVKNYVTNQFNDATPVSDQELKAIHQNLLYRHIAWLYTLRSQLLIPAPWEHISQSKHIRQQTERRRKRFGIGLFDDGLIEQGRLGAAVGGGIGHGDLLDGQRTVPRPGRRVRSDHATDPEERGRRPPACPGPAHGTGRSLGTARRGAYRIGRVDPHRAVRRHRSDRVGRRHRHRHAIR